jgi:hypothetical protein
MQITLTQAQNAIEAQARNTIVTAGAVAEVLENVRGTTIANITQVTQVATSAANKHIDIRKVTVASVTLANNLKAFTSLYANKVKRTSGAAEFKPASNYFVHTDCYSIVQHKTTGEQYLFAMYNNSDSVYVLNDVLVSKETVAQYLTASAAKKLLDNSTTVHNKTNDVTHSAHVRTVKFANIVSFSASKRTLEA